MAAEKRDFAAPLEGLVYWDASFAVANLTDVHRFHVPCREFGDRFEAESSLAVISDFVLNEVAFLAVKGALVAEARRTGRRWLDVKRERPDALRAALAAFAPKRAQLEAQALSLALPDTVTDRAFQLMHNFALLPTDAYHLATGLENGVEAFVTLDQDFLAVDDIIVYTCLG